MPSLSFCLGAMQQRKAYKYFPYRLDCELNYKKAAMAEEVRILSKS